MTKIIVPTDFSGNSKAGIRFAIQWAKQVRADLLFLHVLYFPGQGQPGESTEQQVEKAIASARLKLTRFVNGIYHQMNTQPGKHSFLVAEGISPDLVILDQGRKLPGIGYICISTRGAGRINKILGTNTGNLIIKSDVPVIAVPASYKTKPINRLLYASDFNDLQNEFELVRTVANELRIPIIIYHKSGKKELIARKELENMALFKTFKYGLKLHIQEKNGNNSIVKNIQNAINEIKPSITVMFTNQNRGFFQKLLLTSKAENLSFNLTAPLLVFKKR